MRDKVELQKILEDNLPSEVMEEWGETFKKLMKLHTLQVAREAVEEEKASWNNDSGILACNRILTRIEKLTEES